MPFLNSIFAYTMDSLATLASSPSPSPSISTITTTTSVNTLITSSNRETKRETPPLPMHLNYTTLSSLSSSSPVTQAIVSDGEGGIGDGGGGGGGQLQVHEVACECCGLVVEECTPGYIAHVRELHCGYWVCGLCSEAVKEKRRRMGRSLKEALHAHRADCLRFDQEERAKPVLCLGDAMRQIIRRNFSSPGGRLRSSRSFDKRLNRDTLNSNPNPNPNLDRNKNLTRSSSCLNPQLRGYE